MLHQQEVLIIDDDEAFVEAITLVLESAYQVRSAHSGEEGLRAIRERLPDLIILDVMMTTVSEGFDVARRLRADPATARIPIIMLTGVDQEYNMTFGPQEDWLPVDRFLTKPVSPARLLEEVAQALASRRP